MIRGLENLSFKERPRVGFVQPREEKALGHLRAAFQYLKWPTVRMESDFLQWHGVIGQGVMALN